MRMDRWFGTRGMSRALTCVALAGVATTASPTFAQTAAGHVSAVSQTVTRTQYAKNLDQIVIPPLDVEALRREDAMRSADGEPPRFAVPKPVHLTPDNSGTWTALDDNTLRWQLRITSPGALSINLGFTGYEMPEGGVLRIGAFDGSSSLRPFTVDDDEVHGQLWTPVLPSDDIVVELTVPRKMLQFTVLELGSINIGYRGFYEAMVEHGSVDRSGSCNLDVVCGAADGWPEVDLWRNEIPGVAVISTGGSAFCTGFVVNNTAQDLTPYFMTANHCGISSGNAPSLVCYWNFENSYCRQPGSAASGGSGDGSLSEFNTGSVFKASYSTSDFTLVELDDPIDPAFQVSYLGWDHSGTDATTAVGIHHPNVDEKRISFEYDPTTVTSYLGTAVPGDGTHVRITDWDVGTTEPGSSGSPLFNQDHQVIGQLHGGYAACGNDLSDYYGRFYRSWTGGGTPSSRLSDWLDPLGTGQLTINTISGAGLQVDPSMGQTHKGPVGGPFSDTPVDYTLTNPGGSSINYQVSLDPGGTAPMLIEGGTSPVSGSLAPAGGITVISVSVDAAAAAALPMGSYSTDVIFEDTTNGRQLVRTHTIDVGLTNFDVTPASDLTGSGPNGGPFGQTQVYTVTSTQPNAVSVSCTASDNWISLDGGAGPINFVLNGMGDSHQVTVGFSSAANSLSPGFYTGSVDFANLSGGTGDTSRGVTLDAGRLTIPSTDTPITISDNSSLSSYLNVPDDVTIGDLNVKIDITHTYIGDLIVELESPAGTVVRLHDRTGSSTDNLITTFDDATNAPDGPGLLADFNGESAMGTWILHVSDNASGDVGQLNSWTLLIGAAALPPPDCVGDIDGDNATNVYDFSIFASNFGSSVPPGTGGDYDSNGVVNVLDFSTLASDFGCPY